YGYAAWRDISSASAPVSHRRRPLSSGVHHLRGALHRRDDPGIGATSTKMRRRRRVGECVLDLRDGRIGDAIEEVHRGDDHPALTVSALRHLLFNPGGL